MNDKGGGGRSLLHYSEESNSPVSKSSAQDLLEEENSNEGKQKNSSINSGAKKKFQSLVQKFPSVAVQEKIIFCIDNSLDLGEDYTVENCDSLSNSIALRNNAIALFMNNKSAIASHTEFGIISVEPGAVKWLSLLNSDIAHSLKTLSEMKPVGTDESTNIDITQIFGCILNEVNIPEFNNSTITFVPPIYIIRVIFVFGNSYVEPRLNFEDPSYTKFIRSPCCFLDVIYLHERVKDSNIVCEIFKSFAKIVSTDSYLLECSRDAVRLFNSMAKLMAHPLQRVVQDKWQF